MGDQACLALRQSAGRGRRGRQWLSPPGNFYGSVSLPIAVQPVCLGGFSLAVGCALAGVLADAGIEDVGLKWPNDVWVGRSKIAGVLLELAPLRAQATPRVVVGVGVNFITPLDAELRQTVTSVTDCLVGATLSLEDFAARWLNALRACRDVYQREGFAGFSATWQRLDRLEGQQVKVLQGEREWFGRAAGVDERGALKVQTSAGEQRVHSGEVSVRLC